MHDWCTACHCKYCRLHRPSCKHVPLPTTLIGARLLVVSCVGFHGALCASYITHIHMFITTISCTSYCIDNPPSIYTSEFQSESERLRVRVLTHARCPTHRATLPMFFPFATTLIEDSDTRTIALAIVFTYGNTRMYIVRIIKYDISFTYHLSLHFEVVCSLTFTCL